MRCNERGNATVIFIILLGGVAFAMANILVLMMTVKGSINVPLAEELYRLCPACLFYFAAAPLLVAALNALMVFQVTRSPATAPDTSSTPVSASPSTPDPAAALQLLALLQQEGRFIDFLQEDIAPYDDAQVGAAVRAIHAGCRKALQDRIRIERIFQEEDGSPISVEDSFDPSSVRLTGNVEGEPPFRGTLQHGGWRAADVSLPKTIGGDVHILAPAEIEIA